MSSIDIIIYAVIAAILLARLWVVFGRRNDEDTQRPNPFATPAPQPRKNEDEKFDAAAATPAFKPILVAPNSLAGALDQIKTLDQTFDEKQFLQNAKSSFSL